MSHSTREDRRAFLRNLQACLVGGAAVTLLPQLELVSRAIAAPPGNDYRALVCIFLFGGNDSYNMLIPYDSAEYSVYSASRGGVYDADNNRFGLGIARDQLVQITDVGGKTWGLHPACADMKPLFDSQELAFVANVGSLVRPVTKAEYKSKTGLPAQLFSHNDQQVSWMRGHAQRIKTNSGWGGLTADRLAALNSGPALPPSISIAGNNVFQFGQSTLPYAMPAAGPSPFTAFRSNSSTADRIRREALRALVAAKYTPVMQDAYAVTGESSLDLNDTLGSALDPANGGDIATAFPSGGLAAQLRLIARMIKVSRTSLGQRRQIYFASLGGFDTHKNQMADDSHSALLGQLGSSLAAFRTALAEIGALNDVTSFTMSDFGRTLNSNGDGTDHAWGGVQLVMGGGAANGGPLRGRQVWGAYPLLELDGELAVGSRGQLIPTTSVNQMGAALSYWLGASQSDLSTIFPGIGNFSPQRLGFLG